MAAVGDTLTPVTFAQLIDAMDMLAHSIPSYEDIAVGIPRLVDAGLLVMRPEGVLATARARSLLSPLPIGSDQSRIGQVEYLLGDEVSERDDVLLPLAGFTPDMYRLIVRQHMGGVRRFTGARSQKGRP